MSFQPPYPPLDPEFIAVRFREPATLSMRAAVMREHTSFHERLELPKEKYTVFRLSGARSATPEDVLATIAELETTSEITRIAQVYRVRDNLVLATERLVVGIRPGGVGAVGDLKRHGYDILGGENNRYLVRLGEFDDPIETASELVRSSVVEFAEPDFITIFNPFPAPSAPSKLIPRPEFDEFLDDQTALRLTNSLQVHGNNVFGDPSVRIAILDLGVDTTHPDLKGVVNCVYDAIEDDVFQQPASHEYHGTACAGLAAAEANRVGIRGVGAGCSLMAIRVARACPNSGLWSMSSNDVVRAIDWAWQHGAAVLNLSWYDTAFSKCVKHALVRARTLGRGGAGCVVIAAAGNRRVRTDTPSVDFPARLYGVLAVAASTSKDDPKRVTKPTDWESAAGPQVGIAAPGVENLTTDNVDTAGFVQVPSPAGDFLKFSGTSSAAPIVAGAAGLIISVNPYLTERQVRQILCSTARKVPKPKDYLPDGRNDRMGFGRLDVAAAVQKAIEMKDEMGEEPGARWVPPNC